MSIWGGIGYWLLKYFAPCGLLGSLTSKSPAKNGDESREEIALENEIVKVMKSNVRRVFAHFPEIGWYKLARFPDYPFWIVAERYSLGPMNNVVSSGIERIQ